MPNLYKFFSSKLKARRQVEEAKELLNSNSNSNTVTFTYHAPIIKCDADKCTHYCNGQCFCSEPLCFKVIKHMKREFTDCTNYQDKESEE